MPDTHATPQVNALAAIVAANLKRLRAEREWSQADLSVRLRAQGLLDWGALIIAKVENGRRRADHLYELAALCAVFEVPIAAFVEGDPTTPLVGPRGKPVPLEQLRSGIEGYGPLTEHYFPGTHEDELKMAESLSISTRELLAAVFDKYGQWSYRLVRDRIAGVDILAHMPNATIRARRGHASRIMGKALAMHIKEAGIEAIWERTRPAWDEYRRAVYEQELETWRRDWFGQFGTMPTPAEIADQFGPFEQHEFGPYNLYRDPDDGTWQ